MSLAEVFWYDPGLQLAANALDPGDNDPTTLPGTIVDLPDGLAERLNEAIDTYAGIEDEILDHLRRTGQPLPPEPPKE